MQKSLLECLKAPKRKPTDELSGLQKSVSMSLQERKARLLSFDSQPHSGGFHINTKSTKSTPSERLSSGVYNLDYAVSFA